MTTAREDDMNDRIRFLECEMAGEKVVTRHILEKARSNGDDIGVLKLQIDRMADDVVLIKGAQVSQGAILNILVQDVREMRGRLEAFERNVTGRFDAVDARFDRMDAWLDTIEQAIAAVHTALTTRDPPA